MDPCHNTHPLSVALIVARELPLDEESVIAALLHDIWEKDDKYDISFLKWNLAKQSMKLLMACIRSAM